MELMNKLNEKQYEAVVNTEGYIRVNDSTKSIFQNGFMLQKNAM